MTDHHEEQHPEPEPNRAAGHRSRHLLRLLWIPLAGALLILGGVLLLGQGPTDFGWFAYAPLPEEGVFDGLVLVDRSMQAGALLVLAGAVVLAFWLGLLAGRRRRPAAPRTSA